MSKLNVAYERSLKLCRQAASTLVKILEKPKAAKWKKDPPTYRNDKEG